MLGVPAVFHSLYCLDLLRQYTWLQSGNYGPSPVNNKNEFITYPLVSLPPSFQNSTDLENRVRVDSCIETIRQALMCTADMAPLFVVEGEGENRKKLGLKRLVKCKDWKQIFGRDLVSERLGVGLVIAKADDNGFWE